MKNSSKKKKFSSVEEFFEYLPENERKIVERLREVVFKCIPDCTESLAYNVPYYKKFSNICFIWPPAVSWGSVEQKGVRLGFVNGNMMQDEINYLDKGERKQVYWKEFTDESEIQEDLLKAYLFDAAEVDIKVKKAKAIKRAVKKFKN
jgi:hypothetical protein